MHTSIYRVYEFAGVDRWNGTVDWSTGATEWSTGVGVANFVRRL